MSSAPPVYDLVLILDPAVEESAREQIVADARKLIATEGEELRHDEWGDRALAYPIDHKADGHYHLVQFHSTPTLLERLQRTLRITDGVIRFRIIKLKPGTPEAPSMQPARREAETADAPEPVSEPAPASAPA